MHFRMDAPPVLTEDTVELVKDREDVEDVSEVIDESGSPFVAKIDARADARLGQTIPLVVDTSRLHVFDPKDGRAIA